MKNKTILTLAAAICCFCGCSVDRDYDPLAPRNREITLFEKEITVPVGTAGPLKLERLLGNFLTEGIRFDEDSLLYVDTVSEFWKKNVWELASGTEDPSQPATISLGDKHVYLSKGSPILSMPGFRSCNPSFSFKVVNPLWGSAGLSGSFSLLRMDPETYDDVEIDSFACEDLRLKDWGSATVVWQPQAATSFFPEEFSLKDVRLSLPADATSDIYSQNDPAFTFSYRLKSGISIGEGLDFTLPLSSFRVPVPIGQFRLRDCEITLRIANTFPACLVIQDLAVVDETGDPVEGLSVESNMNIEGGTLEHPAVTDLVLHVKSESGPISDIEYLSANVSLRGYEQFASVPLSAAMGISLASSSATIRGGITIPDNTRDNEQ